MAVTVLSRLGWTMWSLALVLFVLDASHPLDPVRHQYLVAPTGRIRINGQEAQPRDGIAITGEATIEVEALDDAELVLVDAA